LWADGRGSGTSNSVAACRSALSNANIARAEASIGAGVIGHVAWLSTMLVVTLDRLGPIGPSWFVIIRQFTGAASASAYAALAGRFRRECILAGAIVARGLTVSLVTPVLELQAANSLLLLLVAVEGFTSSAPKALHDAPGCPLCW